MIVDAGQHLGFTAVGQGQLRARTLTDFGEPRALSAYLHELQVKARSETAARQLSRISGTPAKVVHTTPQPFQPTSDLLALERMNGPLPERGCVELLIRGTPPFVR